MKAHPMSNGMESPGRWVWDEGTLIVGDCLVLLPGLEDHSIDLVLCDLPYGTTARGWDKKIDLEKLWEQYKRLLKSNGNIILTSSQPFTTELINSNPKHFKYEWVWVKNNATGFQHAKNRPLKNHENILVFSYGSMGHKSLLGGRRMPYYPQGIIRVDKIGRTSRSRFNMVGGKRPSHTEKHLTEFENYPKTVLTFNGEKGLHPTQKPVALFEYLIRTYSKPGDLVLDNCCGSGTTAIACINTDRRFTVMEADPEFAGKARARIENRLRKIKKK